MIFREDKHTELKETISKTFLKTISAFSNLDGGSIYFGVNDEGIIVGLQNIDEERMRIENLINDSIKPLPDYEMIVHKNSSKYFIELKVFTGDNPPYRYNEKTYIRKDTSTVIADDFTLKKLLLKGMNLRYEQVNYNNDNLEFSLLEKMLKEKIGIEKLSKDVLRSMGLYRNNSFNNAAALLADKNDISSSGIDIVRFGDTESIFLDRVREEKVSLLKQYNVALDFFDKWYAPYEEVVGFYRETRIHIPREAYREAIANLLCHRQFMVNAKAKIACYKDKIEIISPGGLPSGIEEEDYLKGKVSVLRNEIVAEVFHRLDIIEKFATGVKRIKREYESFEEKPLFEVSSSTIMVTLPCVSYDKNLIIDVENKKLDMIIIDALSNNKVLSRKEINEIIPLSVSERTLRYTLKNMLEKNQIKKIGAGPSTRYRL